MRPKRNPECHPNRKHEARGLCRPCYLVSRPEYREWHREYVKKWRADNPDKTACHLKTYRLSRRGLTKDGLEERKSAQGGVCAICGMVPKRWCIDHNHLDGRTRGLLCDHCNLVLGHAKDNVKVLERAIVYLEYWGSHATG